MLEKRLAAFEVLQNTPYPTISEEAWRRTNIRRLKLDKIGPSVNGDGSKEMPDRVSSQLTETPSGGEIVQVDGETLSYKLSDELKGQGVIYCDMTTAVNEHPELVQKYFMTPGGHRRRWLLCRTSRRVLAGWLIPLRSQKCTGGGAGSHIAVECERSDLYPYPGCP